MSLMLEEQLYAPIAMKRLDANLPIVEKIARLVDDKQINDIVVVARGTSNHAALYFKYIIEAETGMRVSKFYHSVNTILRAKQNMTNTLCLSISQSGKSTDTIAVTEMAKQNGAVTVAVTNYPDSPIAKMCDFHLFLNCDEENSVAATKTFTLELAVLSMLARALAKKPRFDFDKIADRLTDFTKDYPQIKKTAEQCTDIDNLVVLSRGETVFLAEELCLKLTETSYKMAKAFSVAEFVHGPIAMMDEKRTAIMLAPNGAFASDFVAMAKRLNSLGVRLIAFTDIKEIANLASAVVTMPTDSEAQPYTYAMALQAFAVFIAEALGRNPDVPRGLNKVTITV